MSLFPQEWEAALRLVAKQERELERCADENARLRQVIGDQQALLDAAAAVTHTGDL